jgi:exosortase
VLLLLERLPGLSRSVAPVQRRWLTNLGLMLLGGIVISAAFPASITTVASTLEGGLLADLQLPLPAEVILVFLLLDCWRYWEHRVFHEVPLLWRAHLVHHSDTALDVTTAQRHHPFERLLTTLLALILVFAMGFSTQALGIYLLAATLSALYTHANVILPEPVDRWLRIWLVTPAVHAIHHSSYQPQTDSNYGSILTLWDRLFGTYIDPADIQIPQIGLEYFRRGRDTTLAPVLLQPLEYRQGGQIHEQPDIQQAGTTPGGATLSHEWVQALRFGCMGLALALFALWPTVLDLTQVWSTSEPYQYAWLVLPMFAYLVGWYHRDHILSMTPRTGYTGLPLILLAALLWVAAFVVDIKFGEHVALVLVLQGIALCSLGWSVYYRLLPIMLLLVLMIPCGDILQPLLRGLTVQWIKWFATAADLPHSVEGYVVYVGTHRYVVIDACSGLTFFTLAGFLGYSFSLLLFRSLAKVMALAALGAALGILTNAARVSLIVGLDWLRGSQMDLAAHGEIQWLVLLTSLALLLFLASKLKQDDEVQFPVPARAGTSGANPGRFGPVLAGTVMLACVGMVNALTYRTDNSAAGTNGSLQQLADHYPGSHWLGDAQGKNHSLSIPFSNDMEVIVITPVVGSSRLDEISLRPENENIWRHADTGLYQDCPEPECVTFVHTTWKRKGTNEARHTLYSYYVGEMATDSRFNYRVASGLNRVTGLADSAGLIGFKLYGDMPEGLSLANTFHQLRGSLNIRQNGDSFPNPEQAPDVELAGNHPGTR